MRKKTVKLISDFNVEPLQRVINNSKNLHCKKFDYIDIFHQLENKNNEDFVLI